MHSLCFPFIVKIDVQKHFLLIFIRGVKDGLHTPPLAALLVEPILPDAANGGVQGQGCGPPKVADPQPFLLFCL